jgi:hypothetical protein
VPNSERKDRSGRLAQARHGTDEACVPGHRPMDGHVIERVHPILAVKPNDGFGPCAAPATLEAREAFGGYVDARDLAATLRPMRRRALGSADHGPGRDVVTRPKANLGRLVDPALRVPSS